MPAPWLLALGLVIGLLVLIPARRLQLAGLSSRTIGLYALSLWILAMVVAIAPTATRDRHPDPARRVHRAVRRRAGGDRTHRPSRAAAGPAAAADQERDPTR